MDKKGLDYPTSLNTPRMEIGYPDIAAVSTVHVSTSPETSASGAPDGGDPNNVTYRTPEVIVFVSTMVV